MSAWDAEDPARPPVRSIALPRDGGVMNPATRNRYSVFKKPDVAKRIARERRRLEALAGSAGPQTTAARVVRLADAAAGAKP